MAPPIVPLAVVGAGPAGLAAAWAARARGWEPLILERAGAVGGAWSRMPPALRCLSLRRHDRLADGSVPAGDDPRATAAQVAAALRAFADRARFDIRLDTAVVAVRREAGVFRIETTGGTVEAQRLVVASGEFERPFTPALPGTFEGPSAHARHLDPAQIQPGARVVVIGAGNSGAEIAADLAARGATVTLAARRPPRRPARFPEAGLLGELTHRLSGIPLRLLPLRGGCRDETPLINPRLHEALDRGAVTLIDAVAALAKEGVRTRSGLEIEADQLIWATGYRRDTAWLDGVIALDDRGWPAQREGLARGVPGLAFVGLPCMRTRRSGFLRGFADDAAALIARLS